MDSNTPHEDAGDWDISFGPAVMVDPKYPGSDAFDVLPLPFLRASWRGIVDLGPDAIRLNAPTEGRFKGALVLGISRGRDEDESDELTGLGDIDMAAQAGLDLSVTLLQQQSWQASLGAELRQDLGGTDGLTVEIGPSIAWRVSPRFGLEVSAGAAWADDKHMEGYFGITPDQSAATTFAVYQPESGLRSADLTVGTQWQYGKNWSLITNARLEYLVGDAADSPLVKDEIQPALVFGLVRSF
ncbi:MAG: MipA/OmpV family protein [Hyphomonadaceae bacterium]|nr:MipA/OmpV family protein [Hyphomonadaceae bacterium]